MDKDLFKIFSNAGNLDQRSASVLAAALAAQNLSGFDYLEFKQAVHRLMEEMEMDESTAIRSAFATAATLGLTKEKLIHSAKYYQDVLQKERDKFNKALNNQLDKRIAAKEREVAKLKEQVEDWKAQIAELQKKIAQAEEVLSKAGEELQHALDKLESTKTRFEQTWESISAQIDKDMEQFEALLPD